MFHFHGCWFLRNQRNKGVVNGPAEFSFFKKLLDSTYQVLADYFPERFVENGGHPIWAGAFVGLHHEDGLVDFRRQRGSRQGNINLIIN